MNLRIAILIAFLLPGFAAAAGPATRPTTAKAEWKSLAEGEIRYTEPVGWNAVPLTNDQDLSAAYKNEEGNSLITLHVNVQKQPIPNTPSVAQSLGQQILKAIRADVVKSKAEILQEPKLERDPRFLVRIRDKIKLNGITSDRLHLYRAMGYFLVRTTIDTDNQEPDQVKAAFTAGEQLMAGAVLGKRNPKSPATRPSHQKGQG